jgi:MFS family permease
LYRGLNMFSVLTTEHERPLYMSGIGVCWGLGTILGPVIGGAFAGSSATWRWVGISARPEIRWHINRRAGILY